MTFQSKRTLLDSLRETLSVSCQMWCRTHTNTWFVAFVVACLVLPGSSVLLSSLLLWAFLFFSILFFSFRTFSLFLPPRGAAVIQTKKNTGFPRLLSFLFLFFSFLFFSFLFFSFLFYLFSLFLSYAFLMCDVCLSSVCSLACFLLALFCTLIYLRLCNISPDTTLLSWSAQE